MLAATLVGVFFTPLFYWAAMTWLGGDKRGKAAAAAEPAVPAAPTGGAAAVRPKEPHA